MDDVPIPIPPQLSRFMQQFRALMRARQMAYSTEKTYAHRVAGVIRFHGIRHSRGMGAVEIEAFLSYLIVGRSVSVNTQRSALKALVFLYGQHRKREPMALDFKLAKPTRRIPVVFTDHKARAVIAELSGVHLLAARLMYDNGLRYSLQRWMASLLPPPGVIEPEWRFETIRLNPDIPLLRTVAGSV